MGKDKSEIAYHNKPQRQYLFELLSLLCKATFISCNANQSRHITKLSKIEDDYLNAGPLGGILSAFQFDSSVAWLTLPCDLPFINNETITHLINYRNASKIATVFWNDETKFVEPLVTIWEPSAYPVLIKYFNQGYKSPGKILINADVDLLHPPNISVFKNVNTKDEYEQILKEAEKKFKT